MAVEITPEMCIAGRDLTEPKLDPAGARLAFVARPAGAPAAIVVVDLDDAGAAGVERQLTTAPEPAPGRGMGGGCFAWLPDGSGVVYAAADGNLWHQPAPGGPARPVFAPGDDRVAQAPAIAPDGSFVVAIVDQAEVWLQPLAGGPARRLDGGADDFCFDPVVHPAGTAVAYQAWSVPDMPWDAAVIVTVDLRTGDRDVFAPPGAAAQQPRFAPDGTAVRVHDTSGWLTVWWGDRPVGAGEPPAEVAGPSWGPGQASYAVAPDGDRVALARNEEGFGRLCVAAAGSGAVTTVARGVHGQLSWRGRRLAALRTGARTPTQIVVYDVASFARRVVAVGPVAGWDGAVLPEPELLRLDHDGTTLHARWYASPAPVGPARLLCWLHGGPTDQWPVAFLPRVAYWLGQGWDVLVPDHRGSTGHGRAYQQALRGRWGQLDVADTVAWLDHARATGRADPARTVLCGGSAGGLTVLGVLAQRPERAAGGVVAYPVTDLRELGARSHRFEAHYTVSLVGPAGDEAHRARSPLSWPDRITVPLLVMHGTEDPVVPVDATLAFAEAMRAAGGDVRLELFAGEGHGFRQTDNQLAEFRLTAEFLQRVVP